MNPQGLFHQPLRPWYVHQPFGANRGCIDIKTETQVIACDGNNPPPGFRSVYGPNGHTGVDAWAKHSQNVHCAQRGYVEWIDTNPRTGLDVRIVSEINGEKYRHIYEHLLGYMHKKGDYVETGQLIGWADNTGYSAGDHLHFQIEKWVNGVWVPVNPEPLMSNLFAGDVLWINDKILWIREKIAIINDMMGDRLRKA